MTYIPLVRAGGVDVEPVVDCIAEAFHPLDIAVWLVPDERERAEVLRANFRMVVDNTLAFGRVWTTLDHSGAAVWMPWNLPPDVRPPPPIPDYEDRLAAACGRHVERFRILDSVFAGIHPTAPHNHLAFLAVRPDRQRDGIGSALLEEQHTRLDLTGTAAYLEATSPDARRLYSRHGYFDHREPVDLPGGPRIWPMWRPAMPERVWV